MKAFQRDILISSEGFDKVTRSLHICSLIIIEILAHVLRNEDKIKGINFGDFEVKQILYADDMTLFVRDKGSIEKLQELFQAFREVSGLNN